MLIEKRVNNLNPIFYDKAKNDSKSKSKAKNKKSIFITLKR